MRYGVGALVVFADAAAVACTPENSGMHINRHTHQQAAKQGDKQPNCLLSGVYAADDADDPVAAARRADAAAVARMRAFCHWCCGVLVGSLYPGAPYERKFFAIEVMPARVPCTCQ